MICPKCSADIGEEDGFIVCPGCQAMLYAMDGVVQADNSEEPQDIKPLESNSLQTQPQTQSQSQGSGFEFAGLANSIDSISTMDSFASADSISPIGSLVPTDLITPTVESEVQNFGLETKDNSNIKSDSNNSSSVDSNNSYDFDNPMGSMFPQEGVVNHQGQSDGQGQDGFFSKSQKVNSKIEFQEIADFGNSEINISSFVYDLSLKDINTAEQRQMIKEALTDARFKLNMDQPLSQIEKGILILKNLDPVTTHIIVQRLKDTKIQIVWSQHVP